MSTTSVRNVQAHNHSAPCLTVFSTIAQVHHSVRSKSLGQKEWTLRCLPYWPLEAADFKFFVCSNRNLIRWIPTATITKCIYLLPPHLWAYLLMSALTAEPQVARCTLLHPVVLHVNGQGTSRQGFFFLGLCSRSQCFWWTCWPDDVSMQTTSRWRRPFPQLAEHCRKNIINQWNINTSKDSWHKVHLSHRWK